MQAPEKWELDSVRVRHRWLKLTAKQVRAVWEMETAESRMNVIGDLTSNWDSPSTWERRDYELDRWQPILNPDQFKLFKAEMDRQVQEDEKNMRGYNLRDKKEVEYHSEYLEWVRKDFLPAFHREMKMEGYIVYVSSKDKIDYLRKEFLNDQQRQKKKAIIQHYRYCKRLQPNSLRLALLRNELWTLVPDYVGFINRADDGVKAVGRLFLDQRRSWFAQKSELLLEKLKPIKEQEKAMREKYFGDEAPMGGWHTVIERKSDLSPAEEAWMGYLLMLPGLTSQEPGFLGS